MSEQNAPTCLWAWAHPRSRSTALERSLRERDDTHIVMEPLIYLYYDGPERRSDRNLHPNINGDPATLRDIIKVMTQSHGKPVQFSKNMAYYLETRRMQGADVGRLLRAGTNSFLVREPEATLLSHYKQDPNFDLEEAGYLSLVGLYNRVQDLGLEPTVIEADSFCAQPREMMKAWCQRMEIPFSEKSLSWQAGELPEYDGFRSWTDALEQSSGFQKPRQSKEGVASIPEPARSRIQRYIEACRPLYEYMVRFAIQPNPCNVNPPCSYTPPSPY